MSDTIDSKRRHFLAVSAAFGLGSTLFPGVLWGLAQTAEGEAKKVTKGMIDEAARVAGIEIKDEYKEMMLDDLNEQVEAYHKIHALKIQNEVAPAVLFDPVLPGMKLSSVKRPMRMSAPRALAAPKNMGDLAFYSVRDLAELLRTRKISSVAITEMYLERIRRYDPALHFVITLTDDRALAQAREADREIAAGKYRGPLHGMPWGAKDLLAVKGYRTTWGAGGFEQQRFDYDATVVQRLDKAGAVLLAKITLGALAQGDKWFGGMTRNPWKADQGSSGSSAGSGSGVAAGCMAFAIGTETLGSISSPSTRNGVTGLRPTFGLVPRTGGMALTWTMDKIGPMCRTVEDCAIVLSAIYGPDGHDRTVRDAAFNWDATVDHRTLRIGFLEKEFERELEPDAAAKEKPEDKARRMQMREFDRAALDVMRNKLGWQMKPVLLPEMPWSAMLPILMAEAAAAFDELTRSGRDRLLTEQGKNDWPNTFRAARFIPAVEYVNMNRARTLAMEQFARMFANFDVIVAPTTFNQLMATNLTGHPAAILPSGFRDKHPSDPAKLGDGTPVSISFLGQLYGEAKLLVAAKAYQDATEWHLKRPDLDKALKLAQEEQEKKKSEKKDNT